MDIELSSGREGAGLGRLIEDGSITHYRVLTTSGRCVGAKVPYYLGSTYLFKLYSVGTIICTLVVSVSGPLQLGRPGPQLVSKLVDRDDWCMSPVGNHRYFIPNWKGLHAGADV